MTDQELLTMTEEMLDEKRYMDLRHLLSDLNRADVAQLLEELPEHKQPLVFRILPKELAAQTFAYVESDTQESLIRGFSDRELKEILDDLYIDDTVDMIEEMPANVVGRILKVAPHEMRASINQILQYPQDSAGSLMTTEFVSLKPDMTVADAFVHIRRTGIDKETIYTCYVTDRDRVLIGLVTAKTLMLSESDASIGDIMEDHVISVATHEDQETVAQLFNKYDFLAMPVVDNENRLVGIITVDDAIDVLQEEATEDIEKMAAIVPSDKPYLRMSVIEIFRKRIPWLLLLMISATFTSQIISAYEDALLNAGLVLLTAFIPMLMDTAGNSGSQASVTVIRGLSLGEIEFRHMPKIIWKEIRVAVLCGVTLAAVNFLKLMFIDRVTLPVAAVICLTLVVTVLFAKIVGCTLPMFAKKLGFDPAVMASPFITTIVDALSLVIYFQIATFLLHL